MNTHDESLAVMLLALRDICNLLDDVDEKDILHTFEFSGYISMKDEKALLNKMREWG